MKSSNNTNNNRGRNGRNRNNRNPRQIAARQSLRTELVYADTYEYASMSGSTDSIVFRGNSVYDPYHPVGGHQPLAFDQLSALYNKYYVHGSRIEINFLNKPEIPAPHGQRVLTCCCYPSVNSTISSVLTTVREQPYCKTVFCDTQFTAGASKNMTMQYMSTANVFGSSTTDQDFKSDVTNNPTKEWFWNLFMTTNDVSVPIYVVVQVKIYYDVTFFARKTLSQS